MQRLIILAFTLTIVLCFITKGTASDIEQFVEEPSNIGNAELNALLDADSSIGVHDNQSGREARQFFGGFGRRPFFGGFGRRPFGGGFRRRRFHRRRGFFG